ncbi:glutaredoxin family protein [Chitinimonas koreensis]|uniref:glutaredoxin family protein n=1 Tax=Chitinimonas koreensis TaxID=356302 RepID=UPI0012FCD570|nr:glutaredoxin family protein [Chitinimonas koreensis]QNM97218.1 glutaredoxin family protein [Chitinimonas koreensis]
MRKPLKDILLLAAFLGVGLILGLGVNRLVHQFTPRYETGNYRKYYENDTKQVLVFGTSWCRFCKQTRAHLNRLGIAFTDVDIETSKEAKEKFQQLGGENVPLILIGDRLIKGFDQEVIDSALAQIKQK